MTVVEEYIGSAAARYFTNVVTEALWQMVKVDHYKIQRESGGLSFSDVGVELSRMLCLVIMRSR